MGSLTSVEEALDHDRDYKVQWYLITYRKKHILPCALAHTHTHTNIHLELTVHKAIHPSLLLNEQGLRFA